MTTKSPKELLSGLDLIGFKRPAHGGNQAPRRASSAKVTAVEPLNPADAPKGGAPSKSES